MRKSDTINGMMSKMRNEVPKADNQITTPECFFAKRRIAVQSLEGF
jgi:hypothetical protein